MVLGQCASALPTDAACAAVERIWPTINQVTASKVVAVLIAPFHRGFQLANNLAHRPQRKQPLVLMHHTVNAGREHPWASLTIIIVQKDNCLHGATGVFNTARWYS